MAWLSAGVAPLRDAARGALAPSDFPTDFVLAARRARGARAGTDVMTGNAEALAMGAPAFMPVGTPYRAHPPPAVMMVRPLVALGFRGAALVWLGLSLLALAVLAWIGAGVLAGDPRKQSRVALLMFAALALWPPALHNFEKGQWSVPIAAMLALAWAAARRGWPARAGALIAAAGCFKVTPFLVLAALLARPGRWRALAGATAATLTLVAVSAAVMGPEYWLDFLGASGANATGWQTAPANTVSLWGVLARLLIGGPFASPAYVAPAVAHGVWALSAVALLAAASVVTRRAATSSGAAPGLPGMDAPSAAAFAAWSVLAAVLGPLSWSHTATWLVLPACLLLRAAAGSTAAGLTGSAHAAAVLGGLALLTIPRLSLSALAGPLPVSPARGLALGLHLGGAVVLFLVACATRDQNGTPTPSIP